jgi:hypothetical protein
MDVIKINAERITNKTLPIILPLLRLFCLT